MNAKWKIGFHILVTLVIGIVIGAMLNRALVHRWIREALTMRGAGLRVPAPERLLKPVSPDQEAAIQAILDKHAKRLSEIHERYGKEIEAAFKSLKEEIDPLLTPEQKAQFERALPGPPPRFGGGMNFPGGRLPGPPPGGMPFRGEFKLAVLKAELGLSEEQASRIKAILDDFDKKLQESRSAGGAPEGFEAMGRLGEKRDEEIEKVLTPEQREKFRRLERRAFGRPEGPPPLR